MAEINLDLIWKQSFLRVPCTCNFETFWAVL